MTKRSSWCEFDKDTRKYIKKRDNNQCILCHNKGALQIMHVFLNRSHGGKGCKENGVLGCIKCHSILDNPIGKEQIEKSKIYQDECEKYLIVKENLNTRFKTKQDLINYLKFDKIKYLEKQEEKIKLVSKIVCKKCIYFVKDKRNNSSIPTYFCKKKRCIVSKNKEICNNFRKRDDKYV